MHREITDIMNYHHYNVKIICYSAVGLKAAQPRLLGAVN